MATSEKIIPMSVKYLTNHMRSDLSNKKTSYGFSIDDVVRSGIENSDSNIGAYAGDSESYDLFAPLFDKIIDDYHGHKKGQIHTRDLTTDGLQTEDLDPSGHFINSTRVRVARNLSGQAFTAAITLKD